MGGGGGGGGKGLRPEIYFSWLKRHRLENTFYLKMVSPLFLSTYVHCTPFLNPLNKVDEPIN